ncbi:MAG: hypothetical protein ACTH2Y_00960 [Corynebacterium sp.]|uniref:hypothetical protein n=1 Tax=unclassified Corynebacterium TaxID=2624378 RepID=UPI00264782F6|nr:hypothetical protein [Corynebacterium sp.]MDN5582722.1 hypothetical protein [Corynebacterium sp.]MDN5718576.1 hypothetical protein [Corynebacterium sp.]
MRRHLRCLVPVTAVAVLAGACSAEAPGETGETDATFTPVSGDVVVDPGEHPKVNLPVVAPASDPVWSHLSEFQLVNDVPDGGVSVYDGDSIEVERDTEEDGTAAGSVTAQLNGDRDRTELSQVRLVTDQDGTLQDRSVGDYTLSRAEQAPDAPTLTPTRDYPAELAGCGDVEFSVEESVEISDVVTEAPGLGITDVRVDSEGSDGENGTTVSFSLDCAEDFDRYVFSPRVLVDGETSHEVALPPIQLDTVTAEDRIRDHL